MRSYTILFYTSTYWSPGYFGPLSSIEVAAIVLLLSLPRGLKGISLKVDAGISKCSFCFFLNSFCQPWESRKKKTSSWPFHSWQAFHPCCGNPLAGASPPFVIALSQKSDMWCLVVQLQKWNSIKNWIGGNMASWLLQDLPKQVLQSTSIH